MKKLISIIALALAILFAMGTLGLATSDPAMALIGAVLAVLCFLLWRKLRGKKAKATRKGKQAKQSAGSYRHIHIRVAGVTFANDDGSDRQKLLRKIYFGDHPFEDKDHLDVQLQRYTYKGSPAIRVLVNGHQIGNVPADQVSEVLDAMSQPGAVVTACDVSGGGDGYHYGCKIVLRTGA